MSKNTLVNEIYDLSMRLFKNKKITRRTLSTAIDLFTGLKRKSTEFKKNFLEQLKEKTTTKKDVTVAKTKRVIRRKKIKAGEKIKRFLQIKNLKIEQRGAIKDNIKKIRFKGIGNDVPVYFNFIKPKLRELINNQLKIYKNLKFSFNIHILFLLADGNLSSSHFRTKNTTLLNSYEIDKKIDKHIHEVIKRIDEFFKFGSGDRIYKILELDVNIIKINKISAKSYINLPNYIKYKKSCINPKNKDDNECFKWAILAGLIYQDNEKIKDLQRISKLKKYEDKYNLKFDGIKFPININDIEKFEKMNKINIYVMGYEVIKNKFDFYTIKKTKNKYLKTIDLLLIEEDDKKHYVYISNLSGLIVSGLTKYQKKVILCRNCLNHFYDKDKYEYHLKMGCEEHLSTKIIMPTEEEKIIEFKNYSKMNKYPFVIYADFETLNTNNEQKLGNKTKIYGEHKPISYCFKIVCKDGREYEPIIYKGLDCVEHFIKNIMKVSEKILEEMKENKQIIMTIEQEKEFNKAKKCIYCNKDLKDDRVRDHDHFTSEYRGPAHNECNLLSRKPNKIPVFFHNLKGYDGHLIVKAVDNEIKKINCIPTNSERYISFSLNQLEFKDSFQFMASSLEKLSNYLKDDEMKHLRKYFNDDDKFNLLRKKGVFPYEWFDSDKIKF